MITADVGGIGEVVKNYDNGLMVEKENRDNPKAYAEYMIKLIKDKNLKQSIKEGARKIVEEFDVKIVIPTLIDYYKKVVNKYHRRRR